MDKKARELGFCSRLNTLIILALAHVLLHYFVFKRFRPIIFRRLKNFLNSHYFSSSCKFSISQDFSLIKDGFHRPSFFLAQESFITSQDFSTRKDFSLIKEIFHKTKVWQMFIEYRESGKFLKSCGTFTRKIYTFISILYKMFVLSHCWIVWW